jgi:hypothetical protein
VTRDRVAKPLLDLRHAALEVAQMEELEAVGDHRVPRLRLLPQRERLVHEPLGLAEPALQQRVLGLVLGDDPQL